MILLLNGEFVAEQEARVSVFDRGFLYGDGLFETIRVSNGVPFRWEQHWTRFQTGAEYLRLQLPFTEICLREFGSRLVKLRNMPESMLRIVLSRGIGRRGYSPKGADQPTLVMSLHEAPAVTGSTMLQWKLHGSSIRLPAGGPLAQFKTCNKLAQILARTEADSVGGDEALLCNNDGWVVEGSSSNLFWIQDDRVCTPPLSSGILPGVTRAVILELCRQANIPTCESQIAPEGLRQTQGVFVSVSSVGVVEAVSLDNYALAKSPLTKSLNEQYLDLLARETKSPYIHDVKSPALWRHAADGTCRPGPPTRRPEL